MTDHLENARKLTKLLEAEFNFLGLHFGLDFLLGLFPWIGDVIAFALSIYLIYIAIEKGLPGYKIQQMVFYIVVDFIIGLIPFVGDIFDLFYRANVKNLSIIEEHISK